MPVSANQVVTIEYTLKDASDNVIDSSEDGAPLSYLHGANNIIPGLEQALEGANPGDEIQVTVPPEQGYGPRDETLLRQVERSAFEGVEQIEPGMQFRAGDEANPFIVTVTAVDGDTVTVDANHPLAGQTLHFDVKIVDVRDATPEEVAHGHVH